MMTSDTRTHQALDATGTPAAGEVDVGEDLSNLRRIFSSLWVTICGGALFLIALGALLAPYLWTVDPLAINPILRLNPVSADSWLGTDAFGRDVYSRVLHGARASLLVGAGVSVAALSVGLVFGVVAGYFRSLDSLIMRVMDGIMAIPGILLAIALVTFTGASLTTVIVAIAVPEIPRVVRLVRSVILSVRTEPYVEAAISLGTPTATLLLRHMVPSTIAPLIVQGTFVFASAMLAEAAMSFLGVGLPPEIPSWGNIMAEGRPYFLQIPGLILYPGMALGVTILCINIIGDALRDTLDPRMRRNV